MYGPLDHISLKSNKLACSVKNEDSLKGTVMQIM